MNFVHTRGGHCGSSALRDLLEHHGLDYGAGPLSEAMVFGLSGAMAFAFADDLIPFDGSGAKLPFYLNGRSEGLERDLCAHLGITFEVRRSDHPVVGWAWLADELAHGAPTLIWVNLKDLDYQQVKLDNTRHAVVVTAVDEAAGTVAVADHDFHNLQTLGLDALARARSARAFPGPVRHATAILRFPAQLPPLDGAVAAGLRRVLATMRSAEPVAWEISGATGPTTVVTYRQGLSALDALIDSCAGWPQRFGDGLSDALRLLHVLLERAGTGGGFYRRFEARFLDEAAAALDDVQLRAAAAHYTALAAHWREVARSLRQEDVAAAHRAALGGLQQARELEAEGLELLEACLEHQVAGSTA